MDALAHLGRTANGTPPAVRSLRQCCDLAGGDYREIAEQVDALTALRVPALTIAYATARVRSAADLTPDAVEQILRRRVRALEAEADEMHRLANAVADAEFEAAEAERMAREETRCDA